MSQREHSEEELREFLDGLDDNERAGLKVGMLPVRVDEELDEPLTGADGAALMRMNPEGHL